jgi:hypothetical protein
MDPAKDLDKYIGDIVGGLIREAAMLRSKVAFLEAVIASQNQKAANQNKQTEEYICKEPTQ